MWFAWRFGWLEVIVGQRVVVDTLPGSPGAWRIGWCCQSSLAIRGERISEGVEGGEGYGSSDDGTGLAFKVRIANCRPQISVGVRVGIRSAVLYQIRKVLISFMRLQSTFPQQWYFVPAGPRKFDSNGIYSPRRRIRANGERKKAGQEQQIIQTGHDKIAGGLSRTPQQPIDSEASSLRGPPPRGIKALRKYHDFASPAY